MNEAMLVPQTPSGHADVTLSLKRLQYKDHLSRCKDSRHHDLT